MFLNFFSSPPEGERLGEGESELGVPSPNLSPKGERNLPVISSWTAFGIYVLFMLAVYWPVFLSHRFFWEDFFIQEYPIREFCFYIVRFQHALPFWNPYSWAWSPLLADPQCGFWYPTNLLQIVITRLTLPNAVHLPVLVPETMTLLHLPLAAFGVFILLKKEFHVSGIAALLAGLCWGFGVRMVAEQNHSMQIIQLSLLPWETLLLMRAWKSWKYAIGLGLLFGISFLAGQPQTFFFISIFFGCFTLAESLSRRKSKQGLREVLMPVVAYVLAILIAGGITSIQLLPSMELLSLSSRQHLDFGPASSSSLHLGHLINFFVPKFYGEYPGFSIPRSPLVHEDSQYWETAFYWSMLGEILSLFGVVYYWKQRGSSDPRSRYLFFFVVFSIFAFGYGLGPNFILLWPLWKFVPFFDHFRGPNRMVWFLWFSGTLLAGIGLDAILRIPQALQQHKRYFYWACGVFFVTNVLAILGIFDLAFDPHIIRPGMWRLQLPSFIVSVLTAGFFIAIIRGKLSPRIIMLCAALLIACDLYYQDFTWHRNTLDRETTVTQDSSLVALQDFRTQHPKDHAKILELYPKSARNMKANLGMFTRTPTEYANNLKDLAGINPLRLDQSVPPAADSVKRMEIMGIATVLTSDTLKTEYPKSLPFLKLYHEWRVASIHNDSSVLNDTAFDFTKEILLSDSPPSNSEHKNLSDTIVLKEYSENALRIAVSASQPSILLVNDLYYPAWRATVDGKDTKIRRAFGSLRAVPIVAGIHTVEMRYDDPAFDYGWKITLGTLAISILALFIGKKQKNPVTRSLIDDDRSW